jgi:GNT-I family
MTATPIVVFAYRRPDHLERCLASLAANAGASQHPLIVYCDGSAQSAHIAAVERTRAVARAASGFASLQVIERSENYGLARSIIGGVSDTLLAFEQIIVIEDDLVFSPHFLAYMDDALELYATDENVASVLGYFYPVVVARSPDTFFLRGTDCLGWATWRRAWAQFEPDGAKLQQELANRRLTRAFDLDGAYSYSRLLRQQSRGGVSSWAIRWHASAFVKGMVSLYPRKSLVLHAGDDALATNSEDTSWLNGPLAQERVVVVRQPAAEYAPARSALVSYFRKNRQGILRRARRWLRRLSARKRAG